MYRKPTQKEVKARQADAAGGFLLMIFVCFVCGFAFPPIWIWMVYAICKYAIAGL